MLIVAEVKNDKDSGGTNKKQGSPSSKEDVECSSAIIVIDDRLPSKDANPSRNPENDPTVTMTRVITPAKDLAYGKCPTRDRASEEDRMRDRTGREVTANCLCNSLCSHSQDRVKEMQETVDKQEIVGSVLFQEEKTGANRFQVGEIG